SAAADAGHDDRGRAEQAEAHPTAARGPGERRGVRQDTVDRHRVDDVLDLAVAERLIAADQLVSDLLVHAARDVDVAGLCELLQPGGDVDALAIDVIRLDDD